VPVYYLFSNPGNPFVDEFPEVLSVNNLQGDVLGDFMAIKVGDVNGNARPNALAGKEIRNVAGTFHLDADGQSLKAGEEYTVDFTSAELDKRAISGR